MGDRGNSGQKREMRVVGMYIRGYGRGCMIIADCIVSSKGHGRAMRRIPRVRSARARDQATTRGCWKATYPTKSDGGSKERLTH